MNREQQVLGILNEHGFGGQVARQAAAEIARPLPITDAMVRSARTALRLGGMRAALDVALEVQRTDAPPADRIPSPTEAQAALHDAISTVVMATMGSAGYTGPELVEAADKIADTILDQLIRVRGA